MRRSRPSSHSASGGRVKGTRKLVNSVSSRASEESSRKNEAVVAAEMIPGAMALRQRAAIRPGHRPSACHTGHATSGTTIRLTSDSAMARPGRRRSIFSRVQSMRAKVSIRSTTASGHSSGRAAAERFWNRSPIASETGSSVVARPHIRRKT